MRNSQVAAGVAAALAMAGAGAAMAAPPTAAQAAAAGIKIYMSGSSAAAQSVVTFLESSSFCGATNWVEWDSDATAVNFPDFRVVACTAAAGPFAGSLVTVWYRPEGGNVMGALPQINNAPLAQLDLVAFKAGYSVNGGFDCPQNAAQANVKLTCNVGNGFPIGTSTVNGPSDSWPSGVISHTSDIGITDVEPAAVANLALGTINSGAGGSQNDPINYNGTQIYSFLGQDRSVDDLTDAALLPQAQIFQQTFGFFVNNSLGISDLPKEAIAAIYAGTAKDWGKINKSNGLGAVAAAGTTVIVCNREVGSGTRAQADLYLTEDGCNTVGTFNALQDFSGVTGQPANNFATLNELDCVNTHPNSIGYAAVDNSTKIPGTFANITMLSVNGVPATNLNAALGLYTD